MDCKHTNIQTNRRKILSYLSVAAGSTLLPSGSAYAQLSRAQSVATSGTPNPLTFGHVLTTEERAVADDILHNMKRQFTVAMANPDVRYEQPFAKMARTMARKSGSSARHAYQTKARALLASPDSQQRQTFGRFQGAGVQDYQRKVMPQPLRPITAGNGTFLLSSTTTMQKSPASSGVIQRNRTMSSTRSQGRRRITGLKKMKPETYNHIDLYLRSMTVLVETDEIGNDEISMGTSVWLPNGDRMVGNHWEVHGNFSASEGDWRDKTKDFGFGRSVSRVPLNTDWDYEGTYTYNWVTALIETDGGGIHDILKQIWDAVDGEVKKAIATAIGAAVGAAIGSIIPGLGTAIGAAVGFIVGLFCDWFIGLFENKDDYVDESQMTLNLYNHHKSYFQEVWGGDTSNPFDVIFQGDGGKYRGKFLFKVS